MKVQTGPVTIDREVDRIYRNAARELVIRDASLDRRIRILSAGSKTAVVWNPWAKISAEMGDLKDDDYERFVCVETANADLDVVGRCRLAGEYRLAANYRVERDLAEVLKDIKFLAIMRQSEARVVARASALTSSHSSGKRLTETGQGVFSSWANRKHAVPRSASGTRKDEDR